ncbi:MAG TPA: TRAP transporter substrate-binding protein DctP [Rudaea sp.]|jgi:TRAP-type C4-dicarboxylate transport system substrate-binding protein|nr:TRAP transporter substrate-binding protein DctP [Rudaea sp.]
MKKYIFLALAMFVATVANAATTIKIATVAPDGTAWMREMRAGADAVKTKTSDRVEIKYYPGGVMGDEPAVMRKIKIGQLQGGALTGGELSAIDKDAQIYSLPFLFKTPEEVDKVRVDIDPLLKKSFEQVGFEVLGISGGGFAYLMSVKDIKNKDDLKAAKVWVPQGDHVAEAGFKAGGVTPISLPLADVYTSLQTGLIDTAANTPSGAIAFQWHTKIKHMVDLPLTYVVGILVVDKKVFDALSAEDQKILTDELASAFQRLEKINRDDNAQARDALQKQGVTIFKPNADEAGQWESVGAIARKQLIADGEITPDMAAALDKSLAKVRGSAK